MNNVGGYSSDQVREDIESIINLKSVNDRFYEVNRVQSNKKNIIVIPILFTILLLFFILFY